MSKTNDTCRELTSDELNAVSGGANIEWTYTKQDGGGGNDAGPAIAAWNTLLKQYGAA